MCLFLGGAQLSWGLLAFESALYVALLGGWSPFGTPAGCQAFGLSLSGSLPLLGLWVSWSPSVFWVWSCVLLISVGLFHVPLLSWAPPHPPLRMKGKQCVLYLFVRDLLPLLGFLPFYSLMGAGPSHLVCVCLWGACLEPNLTVFCHPSLRLATYLRWGLGWDLPFFFLECLLPVPLCW